MLEELNLRKGNYWNKLMFIKQKKISYQEFYQQNVDKIKILEEKIKELNLKLYLYQNKDNYIKDSQIIFKNKLKKIGLEIIIILLITSSTFCIPLLSLLIIPIIKLLDSYIEYWQDTYSSRKIKIKYRNQDLLLDNIAMLKDELKEETESKKHYKDMINNYENEEQKLRLMINYIEEIINLKIIDLDKENLSFEETPENYREFKRVLKRKGEEDGKNI